MYGLHVCHALALRSHHAWSLVVAGRGGAFACAAGEGTRSSQLRQRSRGQDPRSAFPSRQRTSWPLAALPNVNTQPHRGQAMTCLGHALVVPVQELVTMRKANASLADEHEALRQAHARCGSILGSSSSADGVVRRALKEVSRLSAENLSLSRQAQAATAAANVGWAGCGVSRALAATNEAPPPPPALLSRRRRVLPGGATGAGRSAGSGHGGGAGGGHGT